MDANQQFSTGTSPLDRRMNLPEIPLRKAMKRASCSGHSL
jgi:hypothetical protein